MIEFLSLSGLINGIFALGFGVLVVLKNWRDKVGQLFFLMTATVALWSFGYWQWLSSSTYDGALFWIRIFSVGSLFIPLFYFHWVLTLLRLEEKKRWVLVFLYSVALIFLSLFSSELFIKGLNPKLFFPFWPEPGVLYNFYLLVIYSGLILYSLFILFNSYRKADEAKKGQIFYVFLGTVLGFGGGATNFFLWYDVPILPYGNPLVALFPFFLGYAIIKHKLFDVRVIATELLTFAIWIFLLVRTILAESFRERIIDGGLLILVTFFGILLVRSVLQEVRQREEISRLAEGLRKANTELKKLDQLKSEFVSLTSHQLRTPLSIVKGYISMIQEGTFGPVPDKLKEAIRKVYFSNERLINLVNDFLNLSRIESGRMRYEFEVIPMESLIDNAVEEYREAAKDKKLELIWERPKNPLPPVYIDKEKFYQVIVNLIDNALKYTKEGSVRLELKKEEAAGEGNVVITVEDTGIGMTKEESEALFKRFSRGEGGYKVNVGGLGLGLYLAKRIVSDHGGEIWATSLGREKGSAFHIRIPARGREVERAKQLNDFMEKI